MKKREMTTRFINVKKRAEYIFDHPDKFGIEDSSSLVTGSGIDMAECWAYALCEEMDSDMDEVSSWVVRLSEIVEKVVKPGGSLDQVIGVMKALKKKLK